MEIIKFGQHQGRPIQEVPTQWLMWVATLHNLRRSHQDFISAAMAELQRRLNTDFDGVVSGLKVDTPLPNMKPPVTLEALRKRATRA